MRQIYRASFARFTVYRKAAPVSGSTCHECGNSRNGSLYVYRIEPDSISGRGFDIRGLYCSASCCKSHNGLSRSWGEFQ